MTPDPAQAIVAFLGPAATFTHMAALRHFGDRAVCLPQETIEDIFAQVRRGQASFGVLPVENSTEGSVAHALDALRATDLFIQAEIYLAVAHHLMACGARNEIRAVYSHPQVFGQCRQWLARRMPGIERIEVSSTARAAERAAGDRRAGALAGELAASLYGLNILESGVQDLQDNTTRFLVIGERTADPTGQDKTSLWFSIPHRAGALVDALNALKRHGINMTRIESRPSRMRAWEYLFFIDCEGHARDPALAAALRELETQCTALRVLGSYPQCGPRTAVESGACRS